MSEKNFSRALAAIVLCAFTLPVCAQQPSTTSLARGTVPADASGRKLNLDFESGDLRDWTPTGEAFRDQPVEGDTVNKRRGDMRSGHAGRYWVGSYERFGDQPRGTLTSASFILSKPHVRFLVAGGAREATRVEVVRADNSAVIARVSGDDTEELKPVALDLSKHVGKPVFVRLIDDDSNGWGHLNFDDLTLWDSPPPGPHRSPAHSPDEFAHEGLSPSEAAAAMTVPDGFKVRLVAGEPDIVQPIAFTIDDRGRIWVAEAYSYPRRVPAAQAKDRILIFEDKDGDGQFETRKVFADHLNLVSGIEVGFGGVWVGAAPDFLFIADSNGDDRADGPPKVLLDGWGYQDTHETLNSFTWGPDGWLYGCHGVFAHSRVGKPGTPDAKRVPINAGIWRYHPTRHTFEVFAHGTSNPWGVDFDRHGQAFLTSCVIPHLYHVIQGGRYERQAGPHFNPYNFDDIKTIADHRHYVGANPHAGNGRSQSAGGGHAHAGALIYQGGSWPVEYNGSIFMNNIHGARLNRDTLTPRGSGFVGSHAPDFLLTNDRWSQVVSLKTGPDGSLFMIDWYDKNQCHRNEVEIHDRTNGRIFKVEYTRGQTKPGRDAAALRAFASAVTDPTTLVARLSDDNQWFARHASRLLQERAPGLADGKRTEIVAALNALAFGTRDERVRLNALWALHGIGGLDEPTLLRVLSDPNRYHRAWGVQLATEQSTASDPAHSIPGGLHARFLDLAKSDPSPVVRLYLASALQRLPLESRWGILEGLASHKEDAGDHNIPLMVWYGLEPMAAADPARALALARESKLPDLLSYTVRRVSALGTPESIALLVESIGKTDSDSVKLLIVDGLNESLKGRRTVEAPRAWSKLYAALRESRNSDLRWRSTSLAATFGESSAYATLRDVLADRSESPERRREALGALLKARDTNLSSTLVTLLEDPALRSQSLRGLAAFDDPKAAQAIVSAYSKLTPEDRRDALNTLSARVGSAKTLIAAIAGGKIAAKDVSADLVRQLSNLKNADVDAGIAKHIGIVRASAPDRKKLIEQYRARLTSVPNQPADPELGRAVFAKVCQQCHTLFATGGKVGPELTGSNRADLDYVLSNVLDPSALIGNDYLAQTVATTDGRVLTGLVRARSPDAITLQTANEIVVVPLKEVEEQKQSDKSMMPEDLWQNLNDHEVRSLVAYLASPAQTALRATPENVAGFFNGRDLTGWVGDPALWSVENGEIVGKTTGLAHNQFLRSELSAGDFRLTLQVKLVKNQGNSGVQFRSVALPDGEMKGDQADIGEGWWGKLYEENGRGLIWPESGEKYVHSGEWNSYEIIASGSRVITRINGHTCVDLDDPKGASRGIFALQLHSGGPTEVRFKDLKLELDPKNVPAKATKD